MERVILHSDANNFYASVECLYNPSLRGKPIAVAGDPEARHGIVLAKNNLAKKCGVATGDPLWMARQKCRDIVFVPPHYDLYMHYSKLAREIYGDYTDQVEPYGLDECWLDVSGSTALFGDGKEIADKLRKRIKYELGITVSVGVSYNKVFAKLASDLKKPDATTVIDRAHYQDIVWPLPVETLLYVGPATKDKLARRYIHTIGDLAKANQDMLRRLLGKNGLTLWAWANGMDISPVSAADAAPPVKSIGNSTTTPRDLVSDEDVRVTLYVLAESVAARLREQNLRCGAVQVWLRDNTLSSIERQGSLHAPSCNAADLFDKAYALYQQHKPANPLRSVGIRAYKLSNDADLQISLLPEDKVAQKEEALERTVDVIRRRYGHYAVRRGIMLQHKDLSDLSPKDDHIILPMGHTAS